MYPFIVYEAAKIQTHVPPVLCATLAPHQRIREGILGNVDFFKRKELAMVGPEELIEKPEFWCAMASLCVLNEELTDQVGGACACEGCLIV